MSLSWSFDSSGQFDFPVLILDNSYRYILTGRNEGGDVKFFRCINRQAGCEASASIGSTYHEEGGGEGWGFITQHLLDVTPLEQHTCFNVQTNTSDSAKYDLQDLENCFDSFDIKR